MNDFKEINQIKLKRKDLERAIKLMKIQGDYGNEIFIYLIGRIKDSVGIIDEVYVPEQLCFRSDYGVGVLIDSVSIEDMNNYLYENSVLNIIQLHSHPKEAYHSLSDDMNSIMIKEGQYSIVFPYFGKQQKDYLYGAKIYRLSRKGVWKRVFKNNPEEFLKVIENE